MKTKTMMTAAAFALLLSAPVAVAQMQGMDMQKMMQMMMPADPASTKDLKQAHMDMMRGMHMEFTGDADVDFARSMVKHHEGGIAMAKIQLKHGKDPEMRKMAEKLVSDQRQDNEEFAAWLKKHQK